MIVTVGKGHLQTAAPERRLDNWIATTAGLVSLSPIKKNSGACRQHLTGVHTVLISISNRFAQGMGIRILTSLHQPKPSTAWTTNRCGSLAGAASFSSWRRRARSAIRPFSGRDGKRQTSDEANLPCDASMTNKYPLPRPCRRGRRGVPDRGACRRW